MHIDARTYRSGAACLSGAFEDDTGIRRSVISDMALREVRRMLFWDRTGILFLWLLYVVMLVMFVLDSPPRKAGEWAGLTVMVAMNMLFVMPFRENIRNSVSPSSLVYPGIVECRYFTTASNSRRCWHADVRLSDGTVVEALDLDGLAKSCTKGDHVLLVPLSSIIIVLPDTTS